LEDVVGSDDAGTLHGYAGAADHGGKHGRHGALPDGFDIVGRGGTDVKADFIEATLESPIPGESIADE